jgi:lipocalin-like protein
VSGSFRPVLSPSGCTCGKAFRQGLRDLGYVEGENIILQLGRNAMNGFNRLIRVAALCALSAVPYPVLAQEQPPSKQLQGTWSLVSMDYVRADGSRFQTFGGEPNGIAVFDSSGHFIISVMRSDRPKFSTNDRMKGTQDENQATAQGTMTYFGSYSVDESNHSINIHIVSSSFPNWNGTDQKRVFKVGADDLVLTNPVGSTGGGSAEVVWKRAK